MAGELSSQKSPVYILLVLLFFSSTVFSQQKQEAGDATLRYEYQYLKTGDFDSSIGNIDIGNTESHALLVSGSYVLNQDWSISASLPYIQKRHQGALPHNAVVDFENYTPPDLTVLDDGTYHGGFQDLYLGVQYLAFNGPRVSVTPFISYGRPTNDYAFYAHSAIGRNIWHLPVGVALSYRPYFSDWYFDADIAYVFSEKSLGVDISHWLIHASANYYFSDRFAGKVFLSIKEGYKGQDWPDDFPADSFDYDSAGWYYHDRTIKHNFINAGIGFDYIVTDTYQLSGSVFTMVKSNQVNILELGVSIGITTYF